MMSSDVSSTKERGAELEDNVDDHTRINACYLCLDGGVDDADQPVRRDCACRGTDAGFVHLACLY